MVWAGPRPTNRVSGRFYRPYKEPQKMICEFEKQKRGRRKSGGRIAETAAREMKLIWKNKSKDNKKRSLGAKSVYPNLPFDHQDEPNTAHLNDGGDDGNFRALNQHPPEILSSRQPSQSSDAKQLAESFQAQGNKLAEFGRYGEALGKWEAALTLVPENAVLHEQKAQVLLEIADSWNALKAATRAIELEPSWAEAWITLGRAQLNFGEPDNAIQSFDRALAIKPDSEEARDDRQTALHLVKRRKQLHSSGLSDSTNRYMVGDKSESSHENT